MLAITTKYLSPTNTRGARVKAFTSNGHTVTISYPYELSGEEAHHTAAQALCDKMEWPGKLVGGAVKDGYVFVFTGELK